MKSVLILTFVFMLIMPLTSAVPAQEQIMINSETNQCSYFSAGDECTRCEVPEGWEIIGNAGTECPEGYEQVVADYDCQISTDGPCVGRVVPTVSLDVAGTCQDYNVTVKLVDFPEACYDVKIDVTTSAGRVGEIFDPREGWKSSFYYVLEDFCTTYEPELEKVYHLRVSTRDPVLNFRGSVRYGSSTWNSGYAVVTQDCPETVGILDDHVFWIVSGVAVIIILVGLVLYTKVFRD